MCCCTLWLVLLLFIIKLLISTIFLTFQSWLCASWCKRLHSSRLTCILISSSLLYSDNPAFIHRLHIFHLHKSVILLFFFSPTAADGRKQTHTAHTHPHGTNGVRWQDNTNWFKLPRLCCHHKQGRGGGRTRSAEYEQDRLLIHAMQRQRRILQSSPPPEPECARGGTQRSILQHRHTLTHTQLSMIDGKRHKGQQSAGLHLDRTRLLLHHLDSGDGADPNRSFPTLAGLLYAARVSNCFKGLVL